MNEVFGDVYRKLSKGDQNELDDIIANNREKNVLKSYNKKVLGGAIRRYMKTGVIAVGISLLILAVAIIYFMKKRGEEHIPIPHNDNGVELKELKELKEFKEPKVPKNPLKYYHKEWKICGVKVVVDINKLINITTQGATSDNADAKLILVDAANRKLSNGGGVTGAIWSWFNRLDNDVNFNDQLNIYHGVTEHNSYTDLLMFDESGNNKSLKTIYRGKARNGNPYLLLGYPVLTPIDLESTNVVGIIHSFINPREAGDDSASGRKMLYQCYLNTIYLASQYAGIEGHGKIILVLPFIGGGIYRWGDIYNTDLIVSMLGSFCANHSKIFDNIAEIRFVDNDIGKIEQFSGEKAGGYAGGMDPSLFIAISFMIVCVILLVLLFVRFRMNEPRRSCCQDDLRNRYIGNPTRDFV